MAHHTGRNGASSQGAPRHIVVKASKRDTAQWIIKRAKQTNAKDTIKIFPDKTQLELDAYKRALPQIKDAKKSGKRALITRNGQLIVDGVETTIKPDWWD